MDHSNRTWKLLSSWFVTALLTFGIMMLGEFLSVILGDAVCFPLRPVLGEDALDTYSLYIQTWGCWAAFVSFMLIFPGHRYILRELDPRKRGNGPVFWLLGIALGFGPNALAALAARLNGDIFPDFDRFEILPALLLFFAVYVQSSSEELTCRVFMYRRLLTAYEYPLVAVLGNSLFFSLLHFLNPGITAVAKYNIFIVGVLYSLFIYYWDSFQMAAFAHASWNYTQNILFGLPNSGIVLPYSIFKLDAASAQNSFFYDVGFGLEGTYFVDIMLTVLTVAVFFYGRATTGKRIEKREESGYWYTLPYGM